MNELRTNAKSIQKKILQYIGQTLKCFPDLWHIRRVDFYEKLGIELNIPYENIEHYIRTGFPLPDQSTHELIKTQEELHNAIQNIFDSEVRKRGRVDEKLVTAYSQINDHLFSIIGECYSCIKKFEDCMPFFTDDFENYLISQLVYREAWPPGNKVITQEDRKFLKESLEKWPLRKIGKEQQPNISDEDISTILFAIECINRIGDSTESKD